MPGGTSALIRYSIYFCFEMKKTISTILFISLMITIAFSGPYAKWTKTELTLDNGVVRRIIKLPGNDGNFLTTSYKPLSGEFKYFQAENTDFQFEFGGTIYSGKGKWNLVDIKSVTDQRQGDGAQVTLNSRDKKLQVSVKYLMYPELPLIRKGLIIKNLTDREAGLESVDIEKLDVQAYTSSTYSWIYTDYGRRKVIGPYEGNMQDALVIIHNPDLNAGIVIGNEAPGAIKRTDIFWNTAAICSGLSRKDNRFPFLKWIRPGDSFVTPQVFTIVYNNHRNPDDLRNKTIPDFVRKHMGIRLSELKEKPVFVYNTWNPFKKNINEKLIMELAKAASDAGMKEFVIDDGWQDVYGDWGVDIKKFPNGLKPVFDYVKSVGMKPGLWISVGTADPKSKIYAQHPEFFIKDKNGKPISLVIDDPDKYTACFGTGWYDYIKDILLKLVSDYALEYLKLDFSIVTSPYRLDPSQSGCYSTSHPGHKDHRESLFTNFEFIWKLFDEMHKQFPGLFIDCTFETMGGLQLIDYAMLQHAEGNWLSNFYAPDEMGDLRIRNMAWWRSPAMTATALVIGNLRMDDKEWEMHIKSLAGALPIMLGDPRKLSPVDLKKYRMYSDWLQLMEKKHGIMSYRQDLKGFGEPSEGNWDGFQRVNTDTKSGGIIGVFRHGADEVSRTITINYLDPAKTYEVISTDGKIVVKANGEQLGTKGFNVMIDINYSGELFEVSAI